MKILVTGGSGLLGTHLIPLLEAKGHTISAPTHSEFDLRNTTSRQIVDLIVHAGAYTNVDKAEEEPAECYETNVTGTLNLLQKNYMIPFVYISSEFAKNPVNFYSKTKLEAEELVKKMAEKYLIIRTLFKERPFKHDRAFIDQYTQGDYVDVIAPMIADVIFSDWKKAGSVFYIGTGRKTMFELSKQTKPDVKPMSIKEMKVARPADY